MAKGKYGGKYTKMSLVIKLPSISDVERSKAGSRDTARKFLEGDKFSMNYRIDCSRVCDSLKGTSETLTVISHVFLFQQRSK